MTPPDDRTSAGSADLERRWYLWPLKVFAIVAGIMAIWFPLAVRLLGVAQATKGTVVSFTGDSILGQRANWDGFWYTTIATIGYFYDPNLSPDILTSPAFFPGYPMLMRAVTLIVRDPSLAGILVSLVAGAVGTCFLYRWAHERLGPTRARITVFVLVLYPYSMYLYGIVYADALFFACAVIAFVALDEGHPIVAGVVGALACSTRLVGLAVAVGLVLRLIELRGVLPARGEPRRLHLDRLRRADAALLLPPLGLVGFSVYLNVTFGDPLLFQTSAQAWGQGDGVRTLLKAETWTMLTSELTYLRVELALQLVLLLFALSLTRHVLRRFGWAYAGYVLLILGIPLVTVGNLFGAGRYVLAAFPCFAAFGDIVGDHPARARPLAMVGGALLFANITMFARGMWVS